MHVRTVSPVTSKMEDRAIRTTFVLAWIGVIGVAPWFVAYQYVTTIWGWVGLVTLSIVSIPLGYLLGWRIGFAPYGSFLIKPAPKREVADRDPSGDQTNAMLENVMSDGLGRKTSFP